MSISPKDLDRRVMKVITDKLESGGEVRLHWLVQDVINSFPAISGDDDGIYHLCAHKYVYRVAKAAIKKFEGSEQPDESQPLLDGYESMRAAYSFPRDGEVCIIRTDLCTDNELLARSQEFELQAKSLQHHAKELRRYVMKRQGLVPL